MRSLIGPDHDYGIRSSEGKDIPRAYKGRLDVESGMWDSRVAEDNGRRSGRAIVGGHSRP